MISIYLDRDPLKGLSATQEVAILVHNQFWDFSFREQFEPPPKASGRGVCGSGTFSVPDVSGTLKVLCERERESVCERECVCVRESVCERDTEREWVDRQSSWPSARERVCVRGCV